MNEYEEQAEKFLKETGTEFKAVFLKHDFHFEDDKDKRDIYEITLKRGSREYKFNFGQSLNCSGKYKVLSCISRMGYYKRDEEFTKAFDNGQRLFNEIPEKRLTKYRDYEENKEFSEPTAYDVLSCLSCLTTYEVGNFKDFCDNYGYCEDSIKAEKIYKAVLNEEEGEEYDEERLNAITELKEEVEDYGWDCGICFIPDYMFEDYAQELAFDCYMGNDQNSNPLFSYIDWESWANHLEMDYSSVEFEGTTYLWREA